MLINYVFIFLSFRKEAFGNSLVTDKTVLTSSPQSSGSHKSLNVCNHSSNKQYFCDKLIIISQSHIHIYF